jgi:argininosuccinate lyase
MVEIARDTLHQQYHAQKKNPDVAEIARAKTPASTENHHHLTSKSLPQSYNRDLQSNPHCGVQ